MRDLVPQSPRWEILSSCDRDHEFPGTAHPASVLRARISRSCTREFDSVDTQYVHYEGDLVLIRCAQADAVGGGSDVLRFLSSGNTYDALAHD